MYPYVKWKKICRTNSFLIICFLFAYEVLLQNYITSVFHGHKYPNPKGMVVKGDSGWRFFWKYH